MKSDIPELVIQTKKLGKRFGREWVIKDRNDLLRSGEIIGIRGRNGSGKSTLLRLLCGQLTPSRGKVSWSLNGMDCPLAHWYRSVSWTGPYTEIVEELSVEELLRFHFGLKPLRRELSLKDVPELLDLAGASKRTLLDCSSGMRQRVLLGTALLAETPLLLLDEPTVTLDKQARAWFQAQLTSASVGRLVVVASNDEEDLVQCTRVLSLN